MTKMATAKTIPRDGHLVDDAHNLQDEASVAM